MNWLTGAVYTSVGKKLLMAVTGLIFCIFFNGAPGGKHDAVFRERPVQCVCGASSRTGAAGDGIRVGAVAIWSDPCGDGTFSVLSEFQGASGAIWREQASGRPDPGIGDHAVHGGDIAVVRDHASFQLSFCG